MPHNGQYIGSQGAVQCSMIGSSGDPRCIIKGSKGDPWCPMRGNTGSLGAIQWSKAGSRRSWGDR